MLRNSAFKSALYRKCTNKYLGYDYKGKILKNTMSEKMFTSNNFIYEYLMHIDDMLYEIFNGVKSIRNFMSISRDKHDRDMN